MGAEESSVVAVAVAVAVAAAAVAEAAATAAALAANCRPASVRESGVPSFFKPIRSLWRWLWVWDVASPDSAANGNTAREAVVSEGDELEEKAPLSCTSFSHLSRAHEEIVTRTECRERPSPTLQQHPPATTLVHNDVPASNNVLFEDRLIQTEGNTCIVD